MNAIEKGKRLRAGPVYLVHEWEERVLKYVPEKGGPGAWYARPRGGEEYEVLHSTNLVTEALLEWVEITYKEYKKY